LLSVCLATTVSFGSNIPAFKRHVTFYSKVVGSGVFYAVRVISNTHYVVKGYRDIPLSQATASKHSNALNFTLLLSEGRAGEAWEPYYQMMLFPFPTIKCLSLLPGRFTFVYSSTFSLSLSLSVFRMVLTINSDCFPKQH
jgi:hypothetical protein